MRRVSRRTSATILLLALIGAGCSSYSQRVMDVRTTFGAGDIEETRRQLAEVKAKQYGSRELALADQAIVQLLHGEPAEAERLLLQVRDGFARLDGAALDESVMRLMLDDRRQSYAGEDYEKILVHCLLAIANLMTDGRDVIPYCLQANAMQEQIMEAGFAGISDNPKRNYQRVPLAAYLHGVVQEASHREYDNAARAYGAVAAWNPDFRTAHMDLQRATRGVHSAPGNGALYVLALVGPGPYKREVTAPVTSQSLALASQLLRVLGDEDVPVLSAPVKIAEIVVPPHIVEHVQVTADGRPVGMTETVTDISWLARQQYEAALPYMLAQAVVRRVTKKSVVYAAKGALADTPLVGLAMDAGEFAWELSERADLRCWNLLPGRIQVLRVELPSGSHDVSLQPLGMRGTGARESCRVEIRDGRNSYLLVCFPGPQIAGRIVASN